MLLDSHDSIDLPTFLSDYWQQKPLLIKNALHAFEDFLSAEELAGLACEEEVESRIVYNTADSWQLKNGPFAERDFTFLPENNWTLLVQSVDHWLPEVKQLLQEVPFIPSWRLDDVMISYAAQGGGVGPHFDYYDVFLLQGAGKRQWQLGQHCDATTPVNTDSGQKILEEFTAFDSAELQCGDVLYIPPGLAHWGTATQPGLCYSIGFRAPDMAELLDAFSLHAGENHSADNRYRDPILDISPKPGNIDGRAMKQVKTMLARALDDEELLIRSFGQLMTEPRIPELLATPEEEISAEKMAELLQKGLVLQANPATRFACHHHADSLYFFVNGQCLHFKSPGEQLAGLNDELQSALGMPLDLKNFQRNEDCLRLLSALYNQGSLIEKPA